MLENTASRDFSIEHAMKASFAEERGDVAWPEASVMGVLLVSKEGRNLMRGME